MRWVSLDISGVEHIGLVEGDLVYRLDAPLRLIDLLGDGSALTAACHAAKTRPAEVIAYQDITLNAPIPMPPSVRDFMAFESHVVTSMEALGRSVEPTWYEIPVFYFTNPAAIVGPNDEIGIAPGCLEFDYELEVAAVIGRGGSNLTPREAHDCIAGYTILCDWSARDLQEREMRVGLGPSKGKDTATSLGPWLVTPDELEERRTSEGFDLAMTATVNGQLYSSGNLADLYWSFEEMISYASRGTLLRPGDVIGSGTVGTGCILELALVHGADRYPYLHVGDDVCLRVDGLGEQRTTIVAGKQLVPFSASYGLDRCSPERDG